MRRRKDPRVLAPEALSRAQTEIQKALGLIQLIHTPPPDPNFEKALEILEGSMRAAQRLKGDFPVRTAARLKEAIQLLRSTQAKDKTQKYMDEKGKLLPESSLRDMIRRDLEEHE